MTPPSLAKFNVGDQVRVVRRKLNDYEGRVVRIIWREAGYSKGHYLYFIKTPSTFGTEITVASGEDKIVRVM